MLFNDNGQMYDAFSFLFNKTGMVCARQVVFFMFDIKNWQTLLSPKSVERVKDVESDNREQDLSH